MRNPIDLHKPSKANFLIGNIDDHNRDGRFFCSRSEIQSNRRYKKKKKNQTLPKNRNMGKDRHSRYRRTGNVRPNVKGMALNASGTHDAKEKSWPLAVHAKSQL